ncbi:hypothetical protein CDAR_573901 [Caerostris darwini]|uniref:LAGLIDADG homing endonuclease n=1 Tax=Caerostris darwini TaxID=1538125 RepID=A0AAV4T7B6_9ARAC|nr:hypothetical protein CDAR_573901 [Caerostris darwini]
MPFRFLNPQGHNQEHFQNKCEPRDLRHDWNRYVRLILRLGGASLSARYETVALGKSRLRYSKDWLNALFKNKLDIFCNASDVQQRYL